MWNFTYLQLFILYNKNIWVSYSNQSRGLSIYLMSPNDIKTKSFINQHLREYHLKFFQTNFQILLNNLNNVIYNNRK